MILRRLISLGRDTRVRNLVVDKGYPAYAGRRTVSIHRARVRIVSLPLAVLQVFAQIAISSCHSGAGRMYFSRGHGEFEGVSHLLARPLIVRKKEELLLDDRAANRYRQRHWRGCLGYQGRPGCCRDIG